MSISVHLGHTDRKTAPVGLGLVAAVHGAREHSVFSDDLIDLAGFHTWADLVDSCHQSESCGFDDNL